MRRMKDVVLVGGLEHFSFFYILGRIIPIDLYFSEGCKPPTRVCFSLSYSEYPNFAVAHFGQVSSSYRKVGFLLDDDEAFNFGIIASAK